MYWHWWLLIWMIDEIYVFTLVVSDTTDWCDWCIETGGSWYGWLMLWDWWFLIWPSNLHLSPNCWHGISNISMYIHLNCIVLMSHILVWHYPPLVRSQRSNRVRHSSDSQARRALGSRRPHSNRVSTSACDTRLNCIWPKCICLCICLCLLYLHVWHPITLSLSSLYPGLSKNIAHVWPIVIF